MHDHGCEWQALESLDERAGAGWAEGPMAAPQRWLINSIVNESFTHTRNSLSEKICNEMAALLQDRLADSIDQMLQAKQAHWNVKGSNFIAFA